MVGLLGELVYYFLATSKLTALGLESRKLLLWQQTSAPGAHLHTGFCARLPA